MTTTNQPTTTTPAEDTLTPEQIQAAADDLIHLDDEIKALQDKREAILATLRTLPAGKIELSNGLTLAVSKAPARFSEKKFSQIFPAEEYPHFYKTTTKTVVDREAITPAMVKNFSETGDPRVTVK